MSKRDMQRAARRGAKFLDEKLGRGWRRKIKRRRLDMQSGYYNNGARGECGCIVAQLHPGNTYGGGLRHLDLDYRDATRLGFQLPDEDYSTKQYEKLTDVWLEELRHG